MIARTGVQSSASEYNKWGPHSQTAAVVDFAVENNATWEDAIQFGEEDDTTWDLNGVTFELDVQRNRYDLVPLLSVTTANGRIIIDSPSLRVIHFKVGAADIQTSLTPGTYVYDLIMIYDTDVRVLLMQGTIQIVQGITYPPGP